MTTTQTSESTIEGSSVPSPGTYEIDPSHTHAGFSVKHLGLAKTRGEFRSVSGTVTIAEDVAASAVTAEIDASSFFTGDDTRDTHVRSADFLDVEQYPVLRFVSTGLRGTDGDWVLSGDLTIKSVTRPVELAVDFEGEAIDPWGNDRIAFSATTSINRKDFDINFDHALDGGGLVVGKVISITLDVEATKAQVA